MKANPVVAYKEPILKVLKELGGKATSDQIYELIIRKRFIILTSEDEKKIKISNTTVSRNNFAWALVRLQDKNKKQIQKVKDNPKTYKLL